MQGWHTRHRRRLRFFGLVRLACLKGSTHTLTCNTRAGRKGLWGGGRCQTLTLTAGCPHLAMDRQYWGLGRRILPAQLRAARVGDGSQGRVNIVFNSFEKPRIVNSWWHAHPPLRAPRRLVCPHRAPVCPDLLTMSSHIPVLATSHPNAAVEQPYATLLSRDDDPGPDGKTRMGSKLCPRRVMVCSLKMF